MKNLIDATKQFGYTNQWMTSLDRKGRSPLILASMHGYTSVVELIIKEIIGSTEDEELRKYYINFKDYKGRSSLFYSVADCHLNVVKLLVETGADVETMTNEKHVRPGSTLLMGCAEKNFFECFDFLLEKGANIFSTREDGADATYIAARYGHQKIIERIIEMRDAHVLINRPTFRGRTAFLTAAFHGHMEVCQTLFDHIEDINHQDEDGVSALMYASKGGKGHLVQWLVLNGANPSLKSKDKQNALEFATKNKKKDVAKFLRTCVEETSSVTRRGSVKVTSNNNRYRKGSVVIEQKKNQRRRSLYPEVKLC